MGPGQARRGHIFLPDTKNGRSRSLHLNAKAKEVLEELAARRDLEERSSESEFVSPSRQGTRKGHLFDLRKSFGKACRLAGVENFRIHDLRHTFASLAVTAGVGLYDVQKLLGHADISMNQRYAHLADDGLKRATESVTTYLDKAVA